MSSSAPPSRSGRTRLHLPSITEVVRTVRRPQVPIATAMRRVLERGYTRADLSADILAGLVVGIVALPLSMALGIAVGAPPQAGLYTAVVAGALVALLGGSKFQVTGPTAAFVVILAPIVSKHGLSGLLTAGFMAGLVLIGMGLMRLGRLIQFIPHPVTTGFTTGIAVVIATLQLKDVFGLRTGPMGDHFSEKVEALWRAKLTFQPAELVVAVSTLALLLLVPRVTKKIPAPLIAISAVSLGAAVLSRFVPAFSVATLGSRFHTTVGGVAYAGIPPIPPLPSTPWGDALSLRLIEDLLPSAFAIAMLGAIESLLSAVIADGLTGKKHDPNAELVALGIGNVVAPFFGGIAATGALARTATNIRAGARSPIASVVHAIAVLLSIVVLAPLVAYVPMASLAGLLLLVAWNMSEIHAFTGVVRVAPKSDVAVLLTCFVLTVLFDMVIAIGVGVVLAAILFMRRMAEMTEGRATLQGDTLEHNNVVPDGVGLYEIDGPLFFGAAQNAMGALHAAHGDSYAVLVLNLGRVPVIDGTGLVAIDNAIATLRRQKKEVVIAGPLPKPRSIFEKARLEDRHDGLSFAPDLEAAFALAKRIVRQSRANDDAVAPPLTVDGSARPS